MTGTEQRTLAICIATCRRPEGLRALLASLDRIAVDEALLKPVLYVVDNAPDAPAVASAEDARALSRWPLTYVMEPRRGIVMARNRALDLALPTADLIAFVDDDETVSPDWPASLVDTLDRHGADAVQGPVAPRYARPPPSWIQDLGIFRQGPFEDGMPRNSAATNNVLVRADAIRRYGLRFDPDFNTTGGEDEEMFGRLRLAGGRIVASAHGCIDDTVPAHRMTVAWASRRSFRKGNTLGRIARRGRKDRVLRILKGFGAMARGIVTPLLRPGRVSGLIGGWLEVCRGAGMIAAFLNLRVVEYGPGLLTLDRRGTPLAKVDS